MPRATQPRATGSAPASATRASRQQRCRNAASSPTTYSSAALLGAGTVINPIIKIITTVVILGAVYLFIVKPALDTTNSIFDQTFGAFDEFDSLPNDIQDDINQALEDAASSQVDVDRLQDCIRDAIGPNGANQNRIDRCLERFGP